MKQYILALDQGTTSSRAILFDRRQQIVATAQQEYRQIYPQAGWVEHDPEDIFRSQYAVMTEVIESHRIDPSEIAAIGITNQRETTILWDRKTGEPVYNAIVWQCRRASGIADELKARGLTEYVRETTGLTIDAYFSGPKIIWLLDNVDGIRERAENGELLFGTVETWLIWKLTGGRVHVTDYTNACRTMLFNIHTLDWDGRLLAELDIPASILPKPAGNSEIYGYTDLLGTSVPIAGAIGDQQSALFGQCCYDAGETKITYGTGCFLLTNTGTSPVASRHGLVSTIAAGVNGRVTYALEGSVFIGGAVIQWIRDELCLIEEAGESEYAAERVPDTNGVYLVPAFTGLGAPYWNQYARGCLVGLTRGTNRDHIIRAALESIAYQCMDVVNAMEKDLDRKFPCIRVDGGASRNNFLMQFQADVLNATISRPEIQEATALGAASLAGLAVGFWKDCEEIQSFHTSNRIFTPAMEEETRQTQLAGWEKAVGKSFDWEES